MDAYKAGNVPGEGIQRYSFVTFHQSYGYEEFVEGLRPVLDDEAEGGQVRYEIRPGVFKKLCERARREPQHRFAMVIDEINRGNISKIFGELITLIEATSARVRPMRCRCCCHTRASRSACRATWTSSAQ